MSENVGIMEALLRVQKNIGKIVKSSDNPHFRSKYADLDEVLAVAREALNKENLVLTQCAGKDQYGQYVATSVGDLTNRSIESRVYFSGNEDNMQKIGAATTYARRFGLTSLLALESEDDDAETAVGRGKAAPVTRTAVGQALREARPAAAAQGAASVREESKSNVGTAIKAPDKRAVLDKKLGGLFKIVTDRGTPREQIVAMLEAKYKVSESKKLSDEQVTGFIKDLEALVTTQAQEAK